MIQSFRIVAFLLVLVGVVSPAAAQRAPDMATLDRGDGISKLGIDVGLSFLEFPVYEAALRLELHGQYVTRSGFGIYGMVPLASSFGAADDAEDPDPPDLLPNNATAFGNLEVGALYVVTKSRRFSMVFRGGLALPTASSGRDASATLYSATCPRLTDVALASDAWYLRLSASPLIYFDKVFFRADIGLDIGFEGNGFDNDEYLRLNAGVGVDFGIVAPSLELVNLINFDRDGDSSTHALAITFRFMGEALQPFLTVGAPIDSGDNVDLFLAGGIQFVP